MMHTVLKCVKCRWLVSQNIAQYSTYKNFQISRNLNKTADFKLEETFSISEIFKYYTFG